MSNNMITIGIPYISEIGEKVRMCADIEWDENRSMPLYFEVDKEYEQYLCTERGDAFLVALLTPAMEYNCSIRSLAPISSRLYYQLTNYYVPIMARYNSKYLSNIKITAEISEGSLPSKHAVGVGFSGGVDSLYSIVKHLYCEIPGFKLTHLLFSNQSNTEINEQNKRSWFENERNKLVKIAEDFGLPMVCVYTNAIYFYSYPCFTFGHFNTLGYTACVFALMKLFGIYYQSSSFSMRDFNINLSTFGSAACDIFNLKCLTNENIAFYSTGTEATRLEKVSYIADNQTVQKNLNVCSAAVGGSYNSSEKAINCGICKKCMRTVCELYALDKLDKYENTFNLNIFKKNKQKYIAKMTCVNSSNFAADIVMALKSNNKIHFAFYFWKAVYSPFYFIKNLFSKIFKKDGIMRKLYYILKVDIFLYGYRDEEKYKFYTTEKDR